MEDLSYFIHEELFLLKEEKPSNETLIKEKVEVRYKLGIWNKSTDAKDIQLLHDILKAIHLDLSEVLFGEENLDFCHRWLVFAESFEYEGQQLRPTDRFLINTKTLILAHPLTVLHGSKKNKADLWLILKEEFIP